MFCLFQRPCLSGSTATMLNASQLAQQYATALGCSMTGATSPGTTLLAANTQSPISLSTLSQHHHHHHPSATSTSPYILLSTSASSSEDVCVNGSGAGSADLTNGLLSGKTTGLSSPSTLYFYNQHSTPAMYPTDFLRL